MPDPDDPNKDAIHYIPHRTVRPVYSDDDLRKDSDGDHIADEDEVAWGTDPNKADTDGDGVSDWDEIGANLDPLKDESATPEVSRRVVQEFLAEPFLNDAKQGDVEAARKVAEIYDNPMTAAQEQAFQETGGQPLMSLERERQLLGDTNGPTDPRELERWAEALENYKKALAGDPHAYVDMQEQLSGLRPSDHDLATFIRGGGVPVLAMERQFQLLGGGTERPKEHLARLSGLQDQIDKALGGDLAALDVVGAALGMDRGDLTPDGLTGIAGLVQGLTDPTQFTPGGVTLPGAPGVGSGTSSGGMSADGSSGGQGTSGTTPGGGPMDDQLPRGGMGDIGADGPGAGGASDGGDGSGPGMPGAGPDGSGGGSDGSDGGGAPDVPGSGGSSGTEPADPMGGGSRGDGGGSSLPGGIGPLGPKDSDTPAGERSQPNPAAQSDGRAGGKEADRSSDPIHPVTRPDGTVDRYEQPHADGSKSIYTGDGTYVGDTQPSTPESDSSSSDDGSNSDAGSTDADSDNEPADDTDDAGADVPDDGNSGEGTAYVNPDADSSGGGIGGGVFVLGGGYTDGGRDELQGIDLTGVSVRNPGDRSPYAHVDADSSGGGVGGAVVVAGGGFTDGGRPELQIDLSGVTPVVPGYGDVSFGGESLQIADASFTPEVSAMQLDDFSAQTDGLDSPDDPGIVGFGDGDGQPFP